MTTSIAGAADRRNRRPIAVAAYALAVAAAGLLAGCGPSQEHPDDAAVPVGADLGPPADAAAPVEPRDAAPAPLDQAVDPAAHDLAAPADLAALADLAVGPDMGGPALTLTVLSMNAWSGGLDQVATDIAGSGADVVGMQEISSPEVQQICAALGPAWNFVHDDGAQDYAILSRHPILGRIGVTADAHGGVGATIEVAPGRRAHVFTVHLLYTPYGPYQLAIDKMTTAEVVASENQARMGPLTQLLALAAPYVAAAEPTFLTGDFNAPSDLDYSPAMPWPTAIAPRNAGFVDSWAELHPGNPKKWAGQFLLSDPGITWTPLASSEPNGCYDRIDFVYYSAGDAQPTTSQTLTVPSSDHRLVSTRFVLPRPTVPAWATSPLPADGAAFGSRHALLTWLSGSNAAAERLQLGTSAPGDPQGTVHDGRFRTPLLAKGTTYHWRIDKVGPSGAIMVGNAWSFTTRNGAGVQPDKDVYAAGETIQVAFDGAGAAKDWIGVYRKGDAYGNGAGALSWKYLNDSTSAPGSVAADGSITLAGQPAGSYVIRFFANDGYSVQDETTITVQ